MMKKIIERIGQLFVIGFHGEKPTPDFLQFLEEERIGGVILFEDNCRTHLAARESIERIKAHCKGSVPFIAVDQEGGRVCRLKGAPAAYRSASEYGQTGSLEHYQEDYSRALVLMDSLGINLNLAPVADIFLDKCNHCLESRCFGRTPEEVAQFVEVSLKVAAGQGMLSCVKHFPGLGAAAIDPHEATASADYDMLIWRQREKIPFATAVEAGADMIMTTHLLLPKIDDKIVTGSRKIVSSIIRGELGFDGPVITDDLCMKGAESLGSIGERTVAAFNAGHDLLLFGQDYEESMRAYDYFVDSVRRGEVSKEALSASLDRVTGIKFKLGHSAVS